MPQCFHVTPVAEISLKPGQRAVGHFRKAESGYILASAEDLGGNNIARVARLTPEYGKAMDNGCFSFDLVAEKVLARYAPDQNEHI
jgi:hypothetical protein